MDKWLNVREVAAIIGVSTRMVQKLQASGALKFSKVGKAVRFAEADVVAYMASVSK